MASRLALDVLTILQDTADIFDTPYIVIWARSGLGLRTMQVGFAGYANDHLAATAAETTDVSATALTDTSVSFAVVRHACGATSPTSPSLPAAAGTTTASGFRE